MEDLLEKRRMSMRNISVASQELGVAESTASPNHYRYLKKWIQYAHGRGY